jgi:hypothetical protein
VSLDKRLAAAEEALKVRLRPKKKHDPEALANRIHAALAQSAIYEAMPTDQKLAQKRARLAEVGEWQEPTGFCVNRSPHQHACLRRHLEIDIMALEGAHPDTVEMERWRADVAVRCADNALRMEAAMESYHSAKQAETEPRARLPDDRDNASAPAAVAAASPRRASRRAVPEIDFLSAYRDPDGPPEPIN